MRKRIKWGQTYMVESRSKRKFHWVIPNVVRTTIMYKKNHRDIVIGSLTRCKKQKRKKVGKGSVVEIVFK